MRVVEHWLSLDKNQEPSAAVCDILRRAPSPVSSRVYPGTEACSFLLIFVVRRAPAVSEEFPASWGERARRRWGSPQAPLLG